MIRETTEICICDKCNGRGVVEREELVCHHNGDYDTWTEQCSNCKGSGLIKITHITETRVEPYVPETPIARS